MADELQTRINNRETEYCRFGIEIHLHICAESERRMEWRLANRRRRSLDDCVGPCACCNECRVTEIKYKTVKTVFV